jgi:hypothetical protein
MPVDCLGYMQQGSFAGNEPRRIYSYSMGDSPGSQLCYLSYPLLLFVVLTYTHTRFFLRCTTVLFN